MLCAESCGCALETLASLVSSPGTRRNLLEIRVWTDKVRFFSANDSENFPLPLHCTQDFSKLCHLYAADGMCDLYAASCAIYTWR